MLLAGALILLVLSFPLVLAITRANELFYLRVRVGKIRVTRGRIPRKLLQDIEDVVASVPYANLRGVSEGGRPRLYADGDLGPDHKQRLRNLVGTWTTPQIRTAPRYPGGRN
jgi:hypothetical protein